MSDLTSVAAGGVGATAGAVTLASIGVDPVAIGFGAVGAIVAQSLLRRADEKASARHVLIVMLGSTLFAGGAGPAVSLAFSGAAPIAVQYHVLIALTLGFGAQPIALAMRRTLVKRVGPWLSRLGDSFFGAGGGSGGGGEGEK